MPGEGKQRLLQTAVGVWGPALFLYLMTYSGRWCSQVEPMEVEWAEVFDSLRLGGGRVAAVGAPLTPPKAHGEPNCGDGVAGWCMPWHGARAAASPPLPVQSYSKDVTVQIGVAADEGAPIRLTLLALNDGNYPF